MSPEVARYCKRAIIRHLAGDMDEFQRLVSLAMQIYDSNVEICECGAEMVQAYIKHGKEKKKVWLCMKCMRRKEIYNGDNGAMYNDAGDVERDSRVYSKKTKRKKNCH